MKEIREYVHTNILKVESDIEMLDKPLVDDEISQYEIGCKYHLLVGNNQTVERLNGCLKDLFDTKLRLYSKAMNCDNDNYDLAYCRALTIRNELAKLENVAQNDYVEEAIPITILPSSTESNETVFIFDINMRFKLAF